MHNPPRKSKPIAGSPFVLDRLPAIIIVAALALVPPICLALDDPFFIRVFTRAINLGISAVALNLVLGFGGLVSLMHAAFMGLAGYVVGILAHHELNGDHVPLWFFEIPGTANLLISIPLALLAVAVLSLMTGAICIRTKGIYFIMITLAFNQMLYYLAVAAEPYGGQDGLQILSDLHVAGIPLPGQVGYFYVCLIVLIVILILLEVLVKSRFGAVIVALRQNETRAAALGVSAYPYQLTAFVISGVIAGLGGALFAVSQKFVSPADLAWLRSGDLAIIAVLGGVAAVWGPLLGAITFVVMELVFSSWTIHWLLLIGVFIILVTLFLNEGLAELWKRLIRSLVRRGHG